MSRYVNYSSTVAIPAGQSTVNVPYQILRGNNIVGFGVRWADAANDVDTVLERVRVQVNGDIFWDVSKAALLNWNMAFPRPRQPDWLTIPGFNLYFDDPMAPDFESADRMQLPPGNVELQLTFGAATVADTLNVAIIQTTVKGMFTPRIFGSAMNIPASQTNATYPFSAAGILRAAAWNTLGVGREVLTLGGIEVLKLTGPSFVPAINQIAQYQLDQIDNETVGADPNNPHWYLFGDRFTAPYEGSSLLLDTGAPWTGVSNELTLYTVQPLQIAA